MYVHIVLLPEHNYISVNMYLYHTFFIRCCIKCTNIPEKKYLYNIISFFVSTLSLSETDSDLFVVFLNVLTVLFWDVLRYKSNFRLFYLTRLSTNKQTISNNNLIGKCKKRLRDLCFAKSKIICCFCIKIIILYIVRTGKESNSN